MAPDEAALMQAGREIDQATDEHMRRADAARKAVARRNVGVDQAGVVEKAPPELQSHVAELRQATGSSEMFAEGWEVRLVELDRLRAIQPTIFTDHALERVAAVDPNDLLSVAAISLPLPRMARLPVQYDNLKQAWILSSANPNLRVVGNFAAEVQPGTTGFGFGVRLLPSFLQAAGLHGKYLLRDGYHRAYGFLQKGIRKVPVFFREFSSFDELALPPGMLLQESYLGENPPLLRDYLDDSVAVDVLLPATEKMIVIQALEITPFE